MAVSPITEVLKQMLRFGKGRDANPVGALRTHVEHRQRIAIGVKAHHAVTPDARGAEGIFRQHGG